MIDILISLQAPDAALRKAFPATRRAYLDWLLSQDEIPASYRAHPFADEADLLACKREVEKALGFSLGQLIRLLRVNRLLRSRESAAHNLKRATIRTPLGAMLALFSDKGLCLLEFADRKMLPRELKGLLKSFAGYGIIEGQGDARRLQTQLDEYFAGARQSFDIALDMSGTDFQQQIWRILQTIPYGETASYKTQAERYGNAAAVRAVANANGQNRISILIPCHRVIGSDGSLTGYGGGLHRKKYLLELEQQRHTS